MELLRQVFAMPRTVDEDPLQKFQFRVIVPGYPKMGFTKIANISRETNVVVYTEGCFQYSHKLAGREKIPSLTFERGAFKDSEMEQIYFDTLKDHLHRKTITIEILNRYGDVRRTYVLCEAWASKVEIGELDASSDEVIIDKLTIEFEYFLENNLDYQNVF